MKKLFVVLLALCLPAWSFGQNVERQRKAEAGDASEQYYMAHCYQYGWDGTPEDAAQYAIWLKKAAASGEPGAQIWIILVVRYPDRLEISDSHLALRYQVSARI